MGTVWPAELKVSRDRQRLSVTFTDGEAFDLSAEMLRVLSPSAEVQGHGPGQGLTVPGKRSVAIVSVTPTGNYAIRIGFDDGHDTGIFTWTYLRELGEAGFDLFGAYERALADKGMSRDRAESRAEPPAPVETRPVGMLSPDCHNRVRCAEKTNPKGRF